MKSSWSEGMLTARSSRPQTGDASGNVSGNASSQNRSNAGSNTSSQLVSTPFGARQNALLASLPASELTFLMPHLQPVELTLEKVLYKQRDKLTHVYFPTTAIISLVYLFEDGNMKEIDVVGREGLVGFSRLAGNLALETAKVQGAGYALQLEVSMLEEAVAHCPHLQSLLMRYVQVLLTRLTLNSVYEHQNCIDQQLSHWLLGRLDRQGSNELMVTQELIGNMLGVRRESVTDAACRLRDEGLLQYKRGHIYVIDRVGLERKAGKGYEVIRREFDCSLPGAASFGATQGFRAA